MVFLLRSGSFGDSAAYLSKHAIYRDNSGDKTHEVGPIRTYSNLPNAFGLYDMHGNVWEWTQDWYTNSPRGNVDPVGPSTGANRVIRGGSFYNGAGGLRLAYRGSNKPSYGYNYVGFRLVRTLH